MAIIDEIYDIKREVKKAITTMDILLEEYFRHAEGTSKEDRDFKIVWEHERMANIAEVTNDVLFKIQEQIQSIEYNLKKQEKTNNDKQAE